MRILVVEDEVKTAAYLRKGLTESGFVVDLVERGSDALEFATTGRYELILLDVMLPDRDGWAVAAELRRRRDNTPVFFLTARDAVHDRVRGLELGADDYLVKPFAFAELLARIRNVLRRGGSAARPADTCRVADLEIDFVRHKVTRGGETLDLTPKEFLLLSLLLRRTGEVQSRTVIAEQVWDMSFDGGTNTVDVAVRRLRRKVDDPYPNKLIHTIHGVGYVLEDRS